MPCPARSAGETSAAVPPAVPAVATDASTVVTLSCGLTTTGSAAASSACDNIAHSVQQGVVGAASVYSRSVHLACNVQAKVRTDGA